MACLRSAARRANANVLRTTRWRRGRSARARPNARAIRERGCVHPTRSALPGWCVSGGGIKYGFEGDTCLPEHCDNDVEDASETGVDCGGECGCGATLELLEGGNQVLGVSADGGTIVGFIGSGNDKEGVAWGPDGVRQTLPGGREPRAVNADGSVVVGYGPGAVRWISRGAAEPISSGGFAANVGAANAVSNSGSVIVGVANDGDQYEGFRWNTGTMTGMPDFREITAVSGDGSVLGECSRWATTSSARQFSGPPAMAPSSLRLRHRSPRPTSSPWIPRE